MIVTGSTALAYHLPGTRTNDLDLVGTYDEAQAWRKAFQPRTFFPINEGKTLFMKRNDDICEIDIAWEGTRAAGFLAFAKDNPQHFSLHDGLLVPSLDVLYALKMSHRFLKDSPHFIKTMADIHWLRHKGATINEDIHPYYLKRMADTLSYAHPKLNVSKDGFFDAESTGVPYIYDHDSIHEAVKTYGKPAYQFFKPEDSPVLCDKKMFFAEKQEIQLAAVAEEAYVLALERSLIPYPDGKTPKEAFDMALMKVCTSITSGWFREFAWEHYFQVQSIYDEGYRRKFYRALGAGIVQPFKGSKYAA